MASDADRNSREKESRLGSLQQFSLDALLSDDVIDRHMVWEGNRVRLRPGFVAHVLAVSLIPLAQSVPIVAGGPPNYPVVGRLVLRFFSNIVRIPQNVVLTTLNLKYRDYVQRKLDRLDRELQELGELTAADGSQWMQAAASLRRKRLGDIREEWYRYRRQYEEALYIERLERRVTGGGT